MRNSQNSQNNLKESSNKNRLTKRRKKESKKQNLLLIATFLILILVIFSFFRQRIVINKLEAESNKLLQEQTAANQRIEELVEEIRQSNSLEYIEKRAREELGMIKEDEKIYIDPNDSQLQDQTSNETNNDSQAESDTSEDQSQ